MQTTQEERLMRHAYLYATFSDQPNQLGAILVQDNIILMSAGWSQEIANQPASHIMGAIVACEHSMLDTMLVCTMPPIEEDVPLILLARIAIVKYHVAAKDLVSGSLLHSMDKAIKLLQSEDVEVIPWSGTLGGFTLDYDGKCFTP